MEVICKTVTMILNLRLGMDIIFHTILCRFHTGRDTGIASLDTNLIQQLDAMRE